MSRFLSIKPTKSLTYSSFILLVLGVFLLGYFYYYVPTNKQIIQKDGFLTLRTVADNIADKNKGRQNLYKNFVEEAHTERDPKRRQGRADILLQRNNIDASAQYSTNAVADHINQAKPAELSIQGDTLVYQAWLGRDKLLVYEPIASFLEPILTGQKGELFDSYALACVDCTRSKLVYHDDNLGMRSDVRLDTLLLRNIQGYLAGVRDIQSSAFNQKLFYFPFKMGTTQLVLFGFAQEDLYQQHVRRVPFYFVYPLAITFLLLLVFLPALKFYIMDTDEQVQVSDVVLFGLSVVVGASVLTLIIVQYLLWQGEEGNARRNLKTLSDKIEKSFVQELGEAYACAATLDAFRKRKIHDSTALPVNLDFSNEVRQYVRDSLRKSPHFYLFDRISWVSNRRDSSLGEQLIKAEMVGEPVFANVKERKYFKDLQNGDAFTLPGSSGPTQLFGWEPIYSQTNGGFNITLSKSTDDGYVVALASKMYSVVEAVLPVGYGFCLINGDGKVLLHSNVNRNLRENLFEKAEPATELRGLAASRQEADINEVSLYQNGYMLHIRPVEGLPYSLVTFYNKGFIVPVNMRILIFAFLFSVLSGLTCGLLWLILARTNFRRHPLLVCPMDYLTWLIPQQKLANYYVHGIFFLVVYLVGSLVFNLQWLTDVSSYTRFSTVVLTPINVIGVLHVIGATFRRFSGPLAEKPQNEQLTDTQSQNGQRRLMAVSGIHLAISTAFYLISDYAGYSISFWPFLLFQGVVNGWMWGYVFIRQTELLPFSRWEQGYPVTYTLMLTVLVVNLSVLPSALYSWYGYQPERVQAVKKRQLHLANNIRERGQLLMKRVHFDSLNLNPDEYIKKRVIDQGIYTTDADSNARSIALVSNAPRASGPDSLERLYFTIAENLSNRYYDPKHYPALAEESADGSWRWDRKPGKGQISLYYHNPLPGRAVANSSHCYLSVASVLPDNCFFSPENRFLSIGGLILLILVLWGLYEWLRINTENVFLVKFVRAYAHNEPGPPEPVMSDCLPSPDDRNEKRPDPWIFDDGQVMTLRREDLHVREKEAARLVRDEEIGYENMWRKRRPKEQYLLYDFAYDGLLNYKNTDDIWRLIDEKILIVRDERLRFFDHGFRAFVVNKHGTDELKSLLTKYQQNSTWRSMQSALLLLLAGFVGFVFLTQEAAFNKMLAMAGGITTLLSLLPKIFRGSGDGADNKS